jgi:hypothetical protein
MTRKWTTKYGIAAVLAAVLIISVAVFANPNTLPQPVAGKVSFAVMLTDPPTVPSGTTQLNMTYSNVALDIVSGDGTSSWTQVAGSGTVDLFSLVNMTQTIATTTIPTNSSIDRIQFTIVNVTATVNDVVYNVTTLSNTLVLDVANPQVNQTLSGVLIDFSPTLVQIQATDANGNLVNYYVLVPSATATIINGLDQAQVRVGTIVRIGQNGMERISKVVQDFSQNLTITSASLAGNGNTTSLSVTLQNQGDVTFNVFGVMVQGDFKQTSDYANQFQWPNNGSEGFGVHNIPFQVNGTSLVPMFGTEPIIETMQPMDSPYEGQQAGPSLGMSSMGRFRGFQLPFFGKGRQMQSLGPQIGQQGSTPLALAPGQTVTLTFSGVILLQPHGDFDNAGVVIIPIVGNTYNISLMGEGFSTYQVTATGTS